MMAKATAHLPPRIALVGLDDELGDYLRDWFVRHWPEARVIVRGPGQRLVADLIVVDHVPSDPPDWPTLWLAEIDRSQSVIQLGPRLWRTAMPNTARRLRRVMQTCLDALRTDGGSS